MFTIKLNGEEKTFEKKVRILDLIQPRDYSIIACKVNNRMRELTFEVYYDATVEFVRMDDDDAMRIYESSLRYLFAMAANYLYPDLHIKFSYHISRSIFCRILETDTRFNSSMLREIDLEMQRLVSLDLPITRKVVSNEEARTIYEKNKMYDKIDILQYRPEKTVHLYQCASYINYLYSYMVTSTGYLGNYKLRLYSPGIVLQYPRAELNGEIPPFIDEPTYGETLKRASKWAFRCHAENIAEINSNLNNSEKIDFVNMCEALHNTSLSILADRISRNIDRIKIIAIAGPSSSGKTTFSNRLRIQLMIKGIKPVKLSIDDYYVDRASLVPDDDGSVDYEHINTIDVDLFNQHLVALINGEEVETPSFNFVTGKREIGKKMKISEGQPIIIEGIHALNDALTVSIPRMQKFKIYIAPHSQLNIDNHSPISSTQLRQLRRLVRDHSFRGFTAERTIAIWNSVRRGEFRWIYDNQEGVDFVFNSDLVYELCVLKKHALPLLQSISKDSEYYIDANALIKYLKLFGDIEDELVPCNSLLREFIGGSCFHNV